MRSWLLNIWQPTTNQDSDLSYHILHLLLLIKFLLTISDLASINTDCSCHLRYRCSFAGSGLPGKGEVWALAECHNVCFREALSCAFSKLDLECKDVQVFPSFLVKRQRASLKQSVNLKLSQSMTDGIFPAKWIIIAIRIINRIIYNYLNIYL